MYSRVRTHAHTTPASRAGTTTTARACACRYHSARSSACPNQPSCRDGYSCNAHSGSRDTTDGNLHRSGIRSQNHDGLAPECVWCADTVHLSTHEALFHAGRANDGGLELVPWIVESWETSGDLAYTDFKVHDGIEFHKGWGPLTAHDVVWYFNLIHPLNNPESRHDTGVQQHGILDNAEVVDNKTFRFNWAAFAGHTLWMTYTDVQEGMGPFSKAIYGRQGRRVHGRKYCRHRTF